MLGLGVGMSHRMCAVCRGTRISPLGGRSVLAGVVGYREHEGRWEFLLVRTSNGRFWTFPKGHVDPGETAVEAAAREANEEAGVEGEIDDVMLTKYLHPTTPQGELVETYLMKVSRLTGDHEDDRDPTWVDLAGAKERFALRGVPWAGEQERVLQLALRRLGEPTSTGSS